MQWFDTHAHLDDDQLAGHLPEVLERATQAGVRHVLAVGTTAESSRRCVELAHQWEPVWAAVGIQPNYCAEATDEDWACIEGLATDPRVAAIGETGLDRHWDFAPFDRQQDFFHRHLQLARQAELPVVVHMRDCEGDIIDALRRAALGGAVPGVMHSFTGTQETADECLKLGMYISFAGMVTFKRSDALRRIARSVPRDRLLIETDSPYLSPHPMRKQRPNEPALVVHTGRCLAEVHEIDVAEFAGLTTDNARRLFAKVR